MTIYIHPEVNSRFRADLKHIKKNPIYKTIYRKVLEPFLQKVGECECNLECIAKVIQHKNFKKNIGSNVSISKNEDWVIFKCRVAPDSKGKSSALRFCYIAFPDNMNTVPVTLFQHGDKQRDLSRNKLVELAKSTLEYYSKTKKQGLLETDSKERHIQKY